MRLLATIVRYAVDIILAVYDIVVSVPLWIEHKLSQRVKGETSSDDKVLEEAK
jgi:hypothetical protein